MNEVDRRRFLRMATTTAGATLITGCGSSRDTTTHAMKETPAMKHERAEQLLDLYGVPFPDDFYEFWEWHNALQPEFAESIRGELGIRLVGPFDVLAGRFDNVELRYPAVLHWRYAFDPPEFFTVFAGNTDGLHWGYWFDDPERLSPVVSAFYASDGLDLWIAGNTLFDAIKNWIDGNRGSLNENIEYDPDHADDYRKSLEALSRFEQSLPATSSAVTRKPTRITPERMGVVIPPNAGEPSKLLVRGKQLWFDGDRRRFDVLAQAYDELDRAPLASVVRAHKAYPHLPQLDILEYGIGDYHSMREALSEPEKVIRLEVVNANMSSLPDMSVFFNLEHLSLWGNGLSELPSSLATCQKLRSINLHRNTFDEIPAVLFELSNLEGLHLGLNKISDVGDGLERLGNLKRLSLMGNTIPESEQQRIRAALPETRISF